MGKNLFLFFTAFGGIAQISFVCFEGKIVVELIFPQCSRASKIVSK
jgi:hypothetical protein